MNERIKKITQREYLEVFAKTGHEALKALLIVSCGSAITFLTLLGALLGNDKMAPVLKASFSDFQSAITLFIYSIMCSLLAYVLSFVSHGSFYLRLGYSDKDARYKTLGVIAHSLTVCATLTAFVCIVIFMMGGFRAASGIAHLVSLPQ